MSDRSIRLSIGNGASMPPRRSRRVAHLAPLAHGALAARLRAPPPVVALAVPPPIPIRGDDEDAKVDAALLAALPARIKKGNFRIPGAPLRVDTGDDMNGVDQVEPFATRAFAVIHRTLSSLTRSARRRYQYNTFHLGINFEREVLDRDGGRSHPRVWRYLDLGIFTRGTFNHLDHLKTMIWQDLLEQSEQYGTEFLIYRFNFIINDLEWDIRGACKSAKTRIIDSASGMVLQSFKSKAGNCGPICILRALKKLGVDKLDKAIYATLSSPSDYRDSTVDNSDLGPISVGSVWSPEMLEVNCKRLKINLVVYSVSHLMPEDSPIFGVECAASIATIRLAFCPPDSVYSNGVEGHYLLMCETHSTCERCSEHYDKRATRAHFCQWQCEYCMGTFRTTHVRHSCPEKKEYDALAADSLRLDDITDVEEAKIDYVKEILSIDAEHDAAVVAQWEVAVEKGIPTALLGAGGTGKTTAVCKFIQRLISEGKILPSEVAILAAEAVGVDAYQSNMTDSEVHIGTIHSFLGLRVGFDRSLNAHHIKQLEKRVKKKVQLQLIKLIVIDEIGSCPTSLLETVDMTMRIVRDDHSPFGGAQMIFTGDFRQRSNTSTNEGGSCPIFLSDIWNRLSTEVFKLNFNHRLRDMSVDNKKLNEICLKMSMGVMSSAERAWLCQRTCVDERSVAHNDPEVVHLMMTNIEVWQKGMEQIQKFYEPSDIRTYPVEWKEGVPSRPLVSSEMRKFDQELMVAKGCPVMFTTNSYMKKDGHAFNGTVGTVSSFDDGTICVTLSSGVIVKVTRKPVGKKGEGGKQFDIRNAYARTIHKSQGRTLEKVMIWPRAARISSNSNLGGEACEAALMYVAVSRVTDINNLYFARPLRMDHVTVCSRSVMYMMLIGDLSMGAIRSALSRYMQVQDGSPYHLYAFNMSAAEKTVSVGDKSVMKGRPLPMYSRDEIEAMVAGNIAPVENYYQGNFNEVVYFDYETANKGENQIEEPYMVFARYWVNYAVANTLTYGVDPVSGLQPDCNHKLCLWLFEDIVAPQCQAWIDSKYQRHKTPIRLVAYNGSNFDFTFILRWLLCENTNDKFTIVPVLKGNTIVCLTVFFIHDGRQKKALTVWDPCLILMSSLDDAHESFCPEKHVEMSKDCYPHLWIKSVGADAAFATNAPIAMNYKTAFPYKMWPVVESRLMKGTLLAAPGDKMIYFNPTAELLQYVSKDVIMLENVVESLSLTVWNDVFTGLNIPVWAFPTAASMGFHATILFLDDEHKMEPEFGTSERVTRSRLFRLVKRVDDIVRRAVYGGRTLTRALLFISSQRDAIYAKHLAGTLTAADYTLVDDALFYIDAVGMYHYICMNQRFPFGMHQELVTTEDVQHFFNQFLTRYDDPTFPMFIMRLDMTPNRHDVESAIPHKGKDGRLMWDNTKKIQQEYTSVHILLALRRGYVITNPTWVIAWGTRDVASPFNWTGNTGKLFNTSCKKWFEMREGGGAKKTCGKGLANTSYGGSLRRDFCDEISSYITMPGDESCPQASEYTSRHRDPDYKCDFEKGYMRPDGGSVLCVKWQKKISVDSFLASRCSYIGAFILAYAHELIDDTIETLVGDRRRSGEISFQPHNGDTDSLIMHMKHFKGSKLKYHTTELGAFNDDLKKCWKAPKNIAYGPDKLPLFVKILQSVNPAKKLYSLEVITPDGRFLTIDPKSKGISKGNTNDIMTGKRKREIEIEVEYDGKKAKSGDVEKRREERAKMTTYYEGKEMISKLSNADLLRTVQDIESDGIVATSRRMKKVGANMSDENSSSGIQPYSIKNVILSRHILQGGAKFPPEREAILTPEDPTTCWSVPVKWLPASPACKCYQCVYTRKVAEGVSEAEAASEAKSESEAAEAVEAAEAEAAEAEAAKAAQAAGEEPIFT